MNTKTYVMKTKPPKPIPGREETRESDLNSKLTDTSGWLSRNESSDWLGVSSQTLRNYERRGRLHPQYVYREDAHGCTRRVTVYDPDELKKLPRTARRVIRPREPGAVAAHCFELFSQGKSLKEIVIDLHIVPETVEALREKWLDAEGSKMVIVPEAKKALEKLVGPFTGVTDLVELCEKVVLSSVAMEKLEAAVGLFASTAELVERVTALKRSEEHFKHLQKDNSSDSEA